MANIIKNVKILFGDVEKVPYDVIHEREGYEERFYPARKWICITMKGKERELLFAPMFRKLFNYLAGQNKSNIRLDMTTPVASYVIPGADPTCETTFTMGIGIPQEHHLEPPAPVDDSIFLETRPPQHILTRRFGGYVTDAVVAEEVKELSKILQDAGEENVDYKNYYIAGYDPPFKPLGRRNEIWFVKKMPEAVTGDQ